MRMRQLTLTIALVAVPAAAGFSIAAQPPPATAAPQAPRPATQATAPVPAPAVQTSPPRREGQPINVKVEVTIADQRGGTQALKKTVTAVIGDRMSGFIRSSANYSSIGQVPLNLDAEPEILAENKVRLRLNLQYNLPAASSEAAEMPGAGALRTTQIHENLAMILESGRPLVVAQSADPVGDRQVTIEVKATVLR